MTRLAAGALTLALALSACGGGSKKTSSTNASNGPQPVTTSFPKEAPPAPDALPPVRAPQPLRSSATLVASSSSNRPKTKLRVWAVKVVPSMKPGFLQKGLVGNGKIVAIQLTLKNVGFATWSGSPASDSALITSHDKQAPGMTVGGGCVGAFATRAELSPGEVQHGCVAFVLHRGETAKLFQFSPDYPATPPAEWLVGA